MNTLKKVTDLRDVYTHQEDNLYFQYYPFSGVIRCHSKLGMLKVVHLLGESNIDVDWNKTNILKFIVQLPPMFEKQEDYLVGQVLSFCQHYEDIISHEKYKNNVDNRTGAVLNWNSLKVIMSRMIKDKSFDRNKVANWFNSFNIETIRPDEPIISISTKSKDTLVVEGKKWVERLYSKGELIRYTKEQFNEKMEKYGKGTK